MEMQQVGLSVRGDHVRLVTMGNEEQSTVFDISQPGFSEGQRPVAGMVEGLGGYGIGLAQA